MRLLLFVFLVDCLSATEFFAPSQTAGLIPILICPTEGIAGSKLVTFGMPFTRGSATVAQLADVRLMNGATEVAAHVEQLTPWRHFTNSAIDGQSVRVARIQFNWTPAAAFPACDTATLQWGGPARTQNIAALTDPRSAWHPVLNSRWGVASRVSEPDVFVVLPKAHLVNGALTFQRGVPFDATISAARDDPQAILAGNAAASVAKRWQSYMKNLFFTHIGEDSPTDPRQGAPWKSDRLAFTVDPITDIFTLAEEWPFWVPDEIVRLGGSSTGVAPGGWPKGIGHYISLTNVDGSPLPARQFYSSLYHPTVVSPRTTTAIGPDDTAVSVASITGLPLVFPFYGTIQPALGWKSGHEWVKVTGVTDTALAIERGQFGSVKVAHGVGEDRFVFQSRGWPIDITSAGSGPLWITTNPEPWLFDRVATIYQYYLSSGFLRPLREAVQQSEHYRNLLVTTAEHATRAGAFSPKCDAYYWPDNQNCLIYSSNEGLAYTYWLMGDDASLPAVGAIKKLFDTLGVPIAWSAAAAYKTSPLAWTERSTGLNLKAQVIDYEVSGTPDSKAKLQQSVIDIADHQAGRSGTVPTPFAAGGLWHSYRQHEYDNSCLTTDLNCTIASPWMSVLTINPLVRIYGVSETAEVRGIVTGLGALFTAAANTGAPGSGWNNYCAWDNEPILGIGTNCPKMWSYLLNRTGAIPASGSLASDARTEQVHAPDIAAAICWSWFFSGDPAQKTLCSDTFKYATGMWAYFTRPQPIPGYLTEYRLGRGTARQWNWQFTNANAVMWLNSGVTPYSDNPAFSCRAEAGIVAPAGTFTVQVNCTVTK